VYAFGDLDNLGVHGPLHRRVAGGRRLRRHNRRHGSQSHCRQKKRFQCCESPHRQPIARSVQGIPCHDASPMPTTERGERSARPRAHPGSSRRRSSASGRVSSRRRCQTVNRESRGQILTQDSATNAERTPQPDGAGSAVERRAVTPFLRGRSSPSTGRSRVPGLRTAPASGDLETGRSRDRS
jgi:hypothetical protein